MAKRKRAGVEWVGGLVSMPAYVTGEGEPYRPEMLVWMDPDGAVLGTTVGKPGELLGQAGGSLKSTIERPLLGPAHAPTRVRVSSPELAAALRDEHPSVEVVRGPTPELDAFCEAMRERLGEGGEDEQSYLSPAVGVEAIAAFFRAAAGLFRAEPWKVVPSDQSLFSVTIERLELRDAAMSVIGQLGQSHGLLLFSGIDDFEAYLEAAEAISSGETPATMPPHFSFSFGRGADLPTPLRKEIAAHAWEVAGAEAYPWLVAMDEELVARPPTAEEVTIAEAVALALTEVVPEERALLAAWNGGAPFSRTITVRTHEGELDVTLRAPCEPTARPYAPPYDVLAALAELSNDEDGMRGETRDELEAELIRRFESSPEAKGLSHAPDCQLVMDIAADSLGVTIATLEPAELDEIVFEIIPRKVSADASDARPIIEALRAFYTFLGRELGLKQAEECLEVIGEGSVEELEAALSDTSNFGMAKAFVAAGREAGFDMNTKAGVEAWMHAVSSAPPVGPTGFPAVGAAVRRLDPAAARAKKNKRKAARKARKKSR